MLQNQLSASTYLALIAQFLGDVEINLPEIDRIIPFETVQGIFATVNFAVKNWLAGICKELHSQNEVSFLFSSKLIK